MVEKSAKQFASFLHTLILLTLCRMSAKRRSSFFENVGNLRIVIVIVKIENTCLEHREAHAFF